MKKYFVLSMQLIISLIKCFFIKLLNFNNFFYHPLSIVNLFTTLEIGKQSKLRIGYKVRIKSGSKIKVRDKATIAIGQNTSLNHGCMVVSHSEIIIGKDVQIGPNVLFYDHDHDFRRENGLKDLKYLTEPISIGDNVWIGANVVILKGTKIGDNCVIGAGSIVRGNFEDNSLIIQKRETYIKKIDYV